MPTLLRNCVAPNAIRDYAALILRGIHGSEWENKLRVPVGIVEKWRNSREVELGRNPTADTRLLFYADFGHLKTLIDTYWSEFEPAFGDKGKFFFCLDELRLLRNSDAHGRGLFEFEKNLILGLSGRIRAGIVLARNQMDSLNEHFARIESIRDSLGFTRTIGGSAPSRRTVRVGDRMEFLVTAKDPKGEEIEYGIYWRTPPVWSKSSSLVVPVLPEYVAPLSLLTLGIRTSRMPASTRFEDLWEYQFIVLPS